MRSICKKGSATLVAVLALCALTAGSASAAQWYVGGKALSGSVKLAETVKVEEGVVLSVPKLKVEIKCAGVTLSSSAPPEISGQSTLKVGYFILTACQTIEPVAGCEIEEGKHKSESLEGAVTENASHEDQVQLRTNTSYHQFSEFVFDETDTCEFVLTQHQQVVTGNVTVTMPKGKEELAEQTFVGQGAKESPNGLTFDKDPAYLTGKFKLKLASGKAWSFH